MSKPAKVGKLASREVSISTAVWLLLKTISFTRPASISFFHADFLATVFLRFLRCTKVRFKPLPACEVCTRLVATVPTSESLSLSVVLLGSLLLIISFLEQEGIITSNLTLRFQDERMTLLRQKTLIRGVTK